jgi:L-rhamnose-H+ transport protein
MAAGIPLTVLFLESSSAASIALGAGVLNGSFATPTRFMTRWRWENVWALWALLALFLLPWMVAFATVPNLGAVYQTAEARHALLLVLGFGAGYGIGAICFGLGIDAIGIALNFAIALGTATAVGSAIPLLWFHSNSIFTRRGYVIETGIVVIVVGIVLCGIAGRSKERDQAKQVEAADRRRPPFAKGLAVAILAGAGSAFQNLGLAFGTPLLHRAAELGAGPSSQANVIWAPLLSATFVPYLIFCARLWKKNHSWKYFFAPQTGSYWVFGFVMGALWFSSIVAYGAAAARMADLGPVLGWPLFMSAIILASNVWGLAVGEWKGAARTSLITMFAGLAVLILGFCTLALSSRFV